MGSQVGMLRNTWQFFMVNRFTTLPGLQSGMARTPWRAVSSTWARWVRQRPGWRACSSNVLYITGRPQACEIRLSSRSFSSGLVPPPHWITPAPASRRTSASGNNTDSGHAAPLSPYRRAGGGPLGTFLAHGVEPDRRVTDQRAPVDAQPLPDRAHV